MELRKAALGAAGGLVAGGVATSYLTHVSPTEWGQLVERVGIPFAVLLLVVLVFFTLLRVIAQPLMKSHMDFVATLSDTVKVNAEAAKTNAEAIQNLKSITVTYQATIMETLCRVDGLVKEIHSRRVDDEKEGPTRGVGHSAA